VSEGVEVHLLGDGWEPHVDEVDGELQYSIPVASGFVEMSFTFTISSAQLSVLLDDAYRRSVLHHALHTLLQRTMIRDGDPAMTQERFQSIVDRVLASPPDEVERFVDEVDAAHNIRLRVYVDRDLERLTAEGSQPA